MGCGARGPLSRSGAEGQLGLLPAVGPWPCWSPAFSRKAYVGTSTLSVKGIQPRPSGPAPPAPPSSPALPLDPDMSPTVTGLPFTAQAFPASPLLRQSWYVPRNSPMGFSGPPSPPGPGQGQVSIALKCPPPPFSWGQWPTPPRSPLHAYPQPAVFLLSTGISVSSLAIDRAGNSIGNCV